MVDQRFRRLDIPIVYPAVKLVDHLAEVVPVDFVVALTSPKSASILNGCIEWHRRLIRFGFQQMFWYNLKVWLTVRPARRDIDPARFRLWDLDGN